MSTRPYRITVVGCGAMGSALIRGWLLANLDLVLTVVTPHRESLSALPAIASIKWYAHYQMVPLSAVPDVIVLAVKPNILGQVLATLPSSHALSALLIPVAAGKSLSFYTDKLPSGAQVVKVMPNLPVALHEGMSVGFAPPTICPEQLRLTETLFRALGKFFWLPEEHLFHAATAVSGCGPAYLFLLEEAMLAAAREIGLPPVAAAAIVRQTLLGAAKMLSSELGGAQNLKDAVTSPQGVTCAALAVLDHAERGLRPLLQETFKAAVTRAAEIAH